MGGISIDNFVHNLIEKYGTRSPFELCKKMNIQILFVDLPDKVDGFFLNSKVTSSILINKRLSLPQRKLICAHELGHALLHSDVNAINYEESNPDYIEKLENEADMFSKFLIDD